MVPERRWTGKKFATFCPMCGREFREFHGVILDFLNVDHIASITKSEALALLAKVQGARGSLGFAHKDDEFFLVLMLRMAETDLKLRLGIKSEE